MVLGFGNEFIIGIIKMFGYGGFFGGLLYVVVSDVEGLVCVVVC